MFQGIPLGSKELYAPQDLFVSTTLPKTVVFISSRLVIYSLRPFVKLVVFHGDDDENLSEVHAMLRICGLSYTITVLLFRTIPRIFIFEGQK